MKSMNKLAVAAVLALSSAGLASAQTFHVTGSTAYRVADVSAEVAICGGANGATGAQATAYGAAGTTLTGANESVVQTPSGSIKFENDFSGSIAGDEALVSQIPVTFPKATGTGEIPSPVTTSPSSTTAAAGGTLAAAPVVTESVAPDIAFSDVSFDTAQQVIKASTDKTNATPASSVIVGVVPFVYVYNASSDVLSTLTAENVANGGTGLPTLSMDPQKFTFTWSSGGSALLSFFTGVNADEADTVFPMGRDVDSGTRSTALAETGYNLGGSDIVTTGVAQFFPYDTQTDANSGTTTGVIGLTAAAGTPIGALGGVPAETVDGFNMPLGDGGYNSGGNLATAMSTSFSGLTNTVVMGYLGLSDAKTALTASGTNRQAAQLMSYCGVTFLPFFTTQTAAQQAANSSLIYEGKYTYWGFEHLNADSAASSIATSLKNELNGGIDQLSSNGVTFKSMNVTRNDDGLSVTSAPQ
jgi:hypothetical protein